MNTAALTRRLFVALMPEEGGMASLQEHRRQWKWPPGVRLADAATLHVTLHFLGDVALAQEQALVSALGGVRMAPCNMTLGAATVWAGGIAVLLVDHDHALARLHASIGLTLAGLGMRLDRRPWVPHLTLAWHAQGASPPTADGPIEWRAEHFSLMWSRPAPLRGYVPIATWPDSEQRQAMASKAPDTG